jgi:hypothetical protein
MTNNKNLYFLHEWQIENIIRLVSFKSSTGGNIEETISLITNLLNNDKKTLKQRIRTVKEFYTIIRDINCYLLSYDDLLELIEQNVKSPKTGYYLDQAMDQKIKELASFRLDRKSLKIISFLIKYLIN